MIKNYLITYEKKTYDGRYIETTIHQIRIPALTLFDAVDYAHNTLELEGIKEVRLA
ncbi:Hypothetical protein ARAMI_50 [Enterococcus phage Aramis]|uniref:Uncharacterized protein n=1 Tax=Enterococcus phage Aramis TaxID=2795668 RepID=A0A8D6UB82_9CAUD|nr:Hypothetical protein ARAMI_50 [Enterococcus phage Aramis]